MNTPSTNKYLYTKNLIEAFGFNFSEIFELAKEKVNSSIIENPLDKELETLNAIDMCDTYINMLKDEDIIWYESTLNNLYNEVYQLLVHFVALSIQDTNTTLPRKN